MSLTFHYALVFISNWMIFILGTGQPENNYHPPLGIPLVLSANFGELRPNHFHMGLDFKTQGKEGFDLHSIDDGYVSRVNVSPYGYGLTVYINHPGGITSVYAHCSGLLGRLKSKVLEIQMKSLSSEIEIYFDPEEIPLKKGNVFALSGNSGSSRGPHLHFEIRDSYTEEAINPLLFGFSIQDSKPPHIDYLKVYALDKKGYLMGRTKEVKVINRDGKFFLQGPIQLETSFLQNAGGIGFGISGQDQFDDAANNCGLFQLSLFADDSLFFKQTLDRIKFEHSRYINTYTDYSALYLGRKYHKSFRNAANILGVYDLSTNGVFFPKLEKKHYFKYVIEDHANNQSILQFELEMLPGEKQNEQNWFPASSFIFPNKAYKFSNEHGELIIPVHCSYEPFYLNYFISSNELQFNCLSQPVQNEYVVRLKPLLNVPIAKQYIEVNGRQALRSRYCEGYLQASSRYFGQSKIETDLLPPSIGKGNCKSKISSKTNRIVWPISDNQSGLKDYWITIDDQWAPLEYESKGKFAFFPISNFGLGSHTVVVSAVDYCGNQSDEIFNFEIY